MSIKNIIATFFNFSILVLSVSTTNASLINRGNGLIYDSVQDLTWVQDPLAAIEAARFHPGDGLLGKVATTTLTADGRSNFGDSSIFFNLNAISYLGFSDWRRPQGELDILFSSGNDTTLLLSFTGRSFWADNQQLSDPAHGVFSNNGVFIFDPITNQRALVDRRRFLASEWAVRTGDVATPIPPAIVLMSPALLFLGYMSDRQPLSPNALV